jgi:hypothetical protein
MEITDADRFPSNSVLSFWKLPFLILLTPWSVITRQSCELEIMYYDRPLNFLLTWFIKGKVEAWGSQKLDTSTNGTSCVNFWQLWIRVHLAVCRVVLVVFMLPDIQLISEEHFESWPFNMIILVRMLIRVMISKIKLLWSSLR